MFLHPPVYVLALLLQIPNTFWPTLRPRARANPASPSAPARLHVNEEAGMLEDPQDHGVVDGDTTVNSRFEAKT